MNTRRSRTILAGLAAALLAATPAQAQVGSGQPLGAQDTMRGRITAVQLNERPPQIEIAGLDGEQYDVRLDRKQTRVLQDGRAAELDSLRVGQTVEIEQAAGGESVARIEILDAGRDAERLGAGALTGQPTKLNPEIDASPAQPAPPGGYSAGDKLVRGLANVFTGFLELPRNVYNTTREENMLTGWTVGLGKGFGYTLLRMGAGLYETVSFPFQAPKGYRPIVLPEFVWQAEGPDYL